MPLPCTADRRNEASGQELTADEAGTRGAPKGVATDREVG